MQTISLTQIADQVVFIHLEITCWSGRKTLQPEDLGLTRAELPPDELVSLGDKTLIDPGELQVFTSLRTAARRACLEVGVRFLGGFLVPAPKAQPLLDRLDALEERFNSARDDFLGKFDALVEAWVQAHPRWATLIRSALVPGEYVASRLSFAVQAVRLATPAAVIDHAGLDRAVGGLATTLFEEIGQLAHEALEKSFLGRTQVTRRALRPLATIRDKLDGLAFLDTRVRPVVEAIEQLLDSLPAQGPIQGRDLEALVGFLAIVENPERLKAHGGQLLNPATLEAVAAEFESTPAVPSPDGVDQPAAPPASEPAGAVSEDAESSQTEKTAAVLRNTKLVPTLADLVDDEAGCFF